MIKTNFIAKPGKKEVVLETVYDVPPEVVWKICNDPGLIPQWWGPKEYTTTVEMMDVKPGGHWRFIQKDSSGNEYAFNGEYKKVVEPERIVETFEFEGMPGHIVEDTVTFEDLGGRTRLKTISLFKSIEDRDGMLQSGMEAGSRESRDRLGELIEMQNKNFWPRLLSK